MAAQSYGDSAKTAQSRVPSPNNPNFLDRLIIDTKLPEDPLYAPALEIKCFDARVGGTVVLGTASVSLSAKEPWNGAEYMPPRQHKIVQAVIKMRKDIAKRKAEIANAEAAAKRKQLGGEGASAPGACLYGGALMHTALRVTISLMPSCSLRHLRRHCHCHCHHRHHYRLDHRHGSRGRRQGRRRRAGPGRGDPA